jgi:hypothetical protein
MIGDNDRVMQIAFRCLTIIPLIIQVLLLCHAQAQEKQRVPDSFNYPESPDIIKIDVIIKSKSLSGSITDPGGGALSDVLIEQLEDNWGKRVAAIFTDAKGRFEFTRITPGIYFLKISKPGFNSMLFKIEVTTKKASSKLKFSLKFSN